LVFEPSGRLWWPNPNQSSTWIPIQANQRLVKLDPTENHLHFSSINEGPANPVGRSIPVAFIDYEVSTDQGLTWKWVWRGMPRNGQWVRRGN
jgi:hypothetical protein